MTKINYSDISLDFELDSQGDIILDEEKDAINNSIRNIILSSFGDIPFKNYIGTNIGGLIAENNRESIRSLIRMSISKSIKGNEKRVEIDRLIVDFDEDKYSYFVTIEYKINEVSYQFEVFLK